MYEQYLEQLGRNLGSWANEHVLNIIVIIVGAHLLRRFGARVLTRLIHRTIRRDLFPTELDRKKRLHTLDSLITAASRLAVWLVASIMIVNELGIDTAPLLASAGVVGIALGVGAQSLIKDFVSGIFIITENQYRVGDVVKLSDKSGVVEAITIRTTILRDLDGNVHHIPNGTISVTTNMTIGFSNINENIVVGFETDLDKLEHVINHVGTELAAKAELKNRILEPPHFERVDGFSDKGIIVKILGKTVESEQWLIKGELYRALKKAFDKYHVQFVPESQVRVYQSSRKG